MYRSVKRRSRDESHEEFVSISSEVEYGSSMPLAIGVDPLMYIKRSEYEWVSPSIDEYFEDDEDWDGDY